MTLMEQIQRGKVAAPRRMMLYGTPGIGKSTFAAHSERPIFLQTEEGLGQIECDKFPVAQSLDDVIKALSELYTADHPYRTVVVDTLDWLERLIWAEVCRRKMVESIEDIGYQKGYTFALNHWRDVLMGLDALRRDRDMTVVLVAHCKIEKFDDPANESYDRYSPRLHKLASAVVTEWCDEVLFATYKVYTRQTDEGFNRKKTRAIGDGERVIYTSERPAHVAKNRLNLPDELPLDFSAYARFVAATIPGGVPATVNNPQNEGAPNHG